MSGLRSCSYGGGVQSTALLVLAAQGRIDFPVFLFANVGDDSEHPDTLRYVRDVAIPYGTAHGIEVVELHRIGQRGQHKGERLTLYRELTTDAGGRSIPIPVRMGSNGAPGTRRCTGSYKISVVAREMRRRGATRAQPAIIGIGISVDEIERAKPGIDRLTPVHDRVYPLLDLGLSRHDCARLIAAAGLPVPAKSACWFCPFHDRETWRRLKRQTPELFERACALERTLNERRAALGRDPVWLTRYGRPLAETLDDQLSFDGLDGCDSGWCMT